MVVTAEIVIWWVALASATFPSTLQTAKKLDPHSWLFFSIFWYSCIAVAVTLTVIAYYTGSGANDTCLNVGRESINGMMTTLQNLSTQVVEDNI
ncbi:hypothetical protein HK405_001002, partial [Cladochytrium tenue]